MAEICTTLQLGSTGDQVKFLQQKLREFGYYSYFPDGYFGPITESIVIQYQTDNGLYIDGVVGNQTWTSLGIIDCTYIPFSCSTITVGSVGELVKWAQYFLIQNGFYSGVEDGIFNTTVENSVKAFQTSVGITPPDGIVNPQTWTALGLTDCTRYGCVPNWQCEQPLNGFENDNCGTIRPSTVCSCVPNWQCEQPLNGYESDTNCGESRRLNSVCNPICLEPNCGILITSSIAD